VNAIAELSEATSPALVFPDLRGADGDAVLGEIARGFAASLEGVEAEDVRRGFVEREELGTTALGSGLAIPHCKLDGLSRPRLAIGVHRRGVEFGAPDGAPIRLFLAVVSPVSAPGSHLLVLASIARWARTPGRVDAMVSARDAASMLGLLAPDVGSGTALP